MRCGLEQCGRMSSPLRYSLSHSIRDLPCFRRSIRSRARSCGREGARGLNIALCRASHDATRQSAGTGVLALSSGGGSCELRPACVHAIEGKKRRRVLRLGHMNSWTRETGAAHLRRHSALSPGASHETRYARTPGQAHPQACSAIASSMTSPSCIPCVLKLWKRPIRSVFCFIEGRKVSRTLERQLESDFGLRSGSLL